MPENTPGRPAKKAAAKKGAAKAPAKKAPAKAASSAGAALKTAVDTPAVSARVAAARRVARGHKFTVNLPVIGKVTLPPPEQLAYIGAIAALAVAEVIDWPVALILGAGHLLAQSQHNKFAHEVGEALEDA